MVCLHSGPQGERILDVRISFFLCYDTLLWGDDLRFEDGGKRVSYVKKRSEERSMKQRERERVKE